MPCKIRVLTVVFDSEIKSHEIPALRGAIVKKVGNENRVFHNHLNDKAFLYRYPLVQYKRIDGRPALLCIEFGVDEIHKFFEKKDWSIQIGERWLDMKIYKLQMNQFTMQVWENFFYYNIHNWIALSQDNYRKYNQFETVTERIEFLEHTLVGNILSLAKGIEWDVDRNIQLKITSPVNTHAVTLKEKKVLGFNLDFKTNVFLPNNIGLGKSVSLGFGNIRQIRKDST